MVAPTAAGVATAASEVVLAWLHVQEGPHAQDPPDWQLHAAVVDVVVVFGVAEAGAALVVALAPVAACVVAGSAAGLAAVVLVAGSEKQLEGLALCRACKGVCLDGPWIERSRGSWMAARQVPVRVVNSPPSSSMTHTAANAWRVAFSG